MSEHSQALLDLVDAVQLTAINCTRLYAERNTRPRENDAEAESLDPSYTLNFGKREDGAAFRIALLTELKPSVGDISVEISAEYEAPGFDLSSVEDETLVLFANEVGLMAILPYVRTAIADVTLRVFDAALLMPVIRRGELAFGTADAIRE